MTTLFKIPGGKIKVGDFVSTLIQGTERRGMVLRVNKNSLRINTTDTDTNVGLTVKTKRVVFLSRLRTATFKSARTRRSRHFRCCA